ncbi:MAG TPA: adenylate/guanylate cyclase domain-containing protein [Candidatus Limnocylindria bacterium]|nr:adenylate/guanylate cyclase domain-containing protein [Candidatus Limnocylindria bacterium]
MTSAAPVVCGTCGTENPAGSRFCNGCGSTLGEPAAPAGESRKVVTVLFIDATSSTALGEQLDPESLRAVMTRYFDVMREVIEFHGGSVEKFIGDAVMAVFGVPTVHEDDALRACRAALEIHGRLVALDSEIQAERGASVEWRMGINTGEVVAGDATAGQRIVTGDAVNVAARLEAAAAPGQILLGADTYDLIRNEVTAEPVDPLSLKGKAEPVPAWRLVAVTGAIGRRARPLEAPLVGRRRPLRLLEDAFREAVEERVCHLFTVLGTAGVGKSRVVEEFIAPLGDQSEVAMGRCLAYGHGITYWPVVEAIRGGAGIAETDSAQIADQRLRDVLSDEPESNRVIAVIGHLLGLVESQPPAEDIFWAIRRTFESMARRRPLVLVFDDVHWGEPTFLDLVDHIADWTRDAPILLIAMARPDLLEKRPGWAGGKRWVTTIQLEPLNEDESDELVVGLLGQVDLPDEVRTQIRRASEGNPLFVEELLGKLIDDGFLVHSGDGWAALGDLRSLAIPATIQALLAARLDGLGAEERTVIERAAVEGKVFHRGAVTELAPEPMRPQVRDRLASLMRMELVRPDHASFVGEEAFRFRHLLIRDAAYQAVAKQTRSELHERFASWLERMAADRVGEYEEIIAYHLEQAYQYRVELGPPDAHARELALRAGHLLGEAAVRADGRLDFAATSDLLERAIALLPRADPGRRLLIGRLGAELLPAGGGHRAQTLLEEALEDARAASDERTIARAELGLLIVRSSTESIEGGRIVADAERIRDRLDELGDVEGVQLAELAGAFALFSVGHAADAGRRAQAVHDAHPTNPRLAKEALTMMGVASVWGPTPTDDAIARIRGNLRELPGLGASLGLSRMLALQGRFEEAELEVAAARERFEELGDRFQVTETESVLGVIAARRGHVAEAVAHHRAGFEGKVALGDQAFASTSAVELSRALADAGDLPEAIRIADIAIDTSASDDIASQGGGRAAKAKALSLLGRHEKAEALAREGAAIMGATDYLVLRAECLVDLATVLWRAGKRDAAVATGWEAVGLYEQKGAAFPAEQTRQRIAEWLSTT